MLWWLRSTEVEGVIFCSDKEYFIEVSIIALGILLGSIKRLWNRWFSRNFNLKFIMKDLNFKRDIAKGKALILS